MVAHTLGNIDVLIQCVGAMEQRDDLILPWVMGFFPKKIQTLPAAMRTKPSVKQACADYANVQTGYLAYGMQYKMRRLAIAMLGVPSPDHPAASWAEKYLLSANATFRMQLPNPQRGEAPLFPNTELDDAMFHFRCGDLAFSNHPSFGFMKYDSFARHLDPDVKSIGIATQPFSDNAQTRNADGGNVRKVRCKLLVETFVERLHERFPNAKVRIHNGANETIALTFARTIMAKQVVVAISSFGVYPGVGTFGRGYIRKPDYPKAPNRWLLEPNIESIFDNVKLIEEPRLMMADFR